MVHNVGVLVKAGFESGAIFGGAFGMSCVLVSQLTRRWFPLFTGGVKCLIESMRGGRW